ncbi:Intracellular endo-alpha-(1-_5)-L-arabinanase [Sedimentisphaera cyanobacteriorum]|uniref:Intracellular endo-alpha-(1->5)-L-arabinanase n=1 Tax=Sedimentisphaera cyanobacteriorum TaxID=1940790 RepID=A0A1Q2HL40_9BACT|nr:arabinan endo-1,5-alpha-L-arabinosidase [Sedimentisphaera cyanobacteriorum]AQQ08299.1 Intracellular endo-alpha-(1->5)-L-arabinanase [Sedimentisphaera cyanobacteriorum]
MKSFALYLVIAVIASAGNLYAKEGVLEGMPDPAVISDGQGTYYIFATGKGLPFYRSDDLVEWKRAGTVFDKPVPQWSKKAIPQTEGIWAPDIVKLNDKYYVYYSVSSFGSQRSVIGVARSSSLNPESPEYGWKDLGLVIESHPGKDDFNAIDPAAFQQDDGRAFMVWGSFWGGIKSIEINPDTGKPLRDNPEVSTVAARPDTPEIPNTPSHAIEGAYMVKHKDMYYLFVSWGLCCDGAESTYRVMVGRSENPLGPYFDHEGKPLAEGGGTLVLANNDYWRGPGHNSVLTTEKGSWMVHHTYNTFQLEKQRILQIRPIYWCKNGWPVVGEPLSEDNPKTTEQASPSPDDIIGSWRLSINYGAQKIYDFLPDGRIANHPKAGWKLSGNIIMINWPESNAADRCVVEMSKDSFIGRNQYGDVIRGIQLDH